MSYKVMCHQLTLTFLATLSSHTQVSGFMEDALCMGIPNTYTMLSV